MKSGPQSNPQVSVIVNADDFGFFDGTCKGIIEAGVAGRLTATGIMANGPALERWLPKLLEVNSVSLGVHLNATLGKPLTEEMRRTPLVENGTFPGKVALAAALLLGRLPLEVLLLEWRAQIERCHRLGVQPVFLNSHEHVHMLPSLYRGVRDLANEFGIKYVRAPVPEWRHSLSAAGMIRSGAMAVARAMLADSVENEPLMIGLGPSGRLDMEYLRHRLGDLDQGRIYELMCHPGRSDPDALGEPRLAAYHDWEGELETLLSPQFAVLIEQQRIRLVSFQDLSTDDASCSSRAEPHASKEMYL